MRATDIKVGEVYAVSHMRDATIGTTAWDLRPAKVLEKGVEREENEKGQPTQRTDGVRVALLEADGTTLTGEKQVIRTREVKGGWQEHLDLIEENTQRALEETKKREQAIEDAKHTVKKLTHGILSPEQVAQVNDITLGRVESLEVETIGNGMFVVQGQAQDSVVHVLTDTQWAKVQHTQSDRGFRALRVGQVNVIEGQTDISYIVAAAIAAMKTA